MTAIPLYQLGDDLERIVETLIEQGGELTPALEAELAALEGAFDAKVERCALYVQNLLALAKGADDEAQRLRALATSRANAADRLKDYVRREMERTGRTKVETARIKAWVQKNSRPSISWPEERPIPDAYQRVVVTLDGQKAYADWKAEQLPAGFSVTQGSHLRLK